MVCSSVQFWIYCESDCLSFSFEGTPLYCFKKSIWKLLNCQWPMITKGVRKCIWFFSIALKWRHESWHWSKEFCTSVYSVMNAMIMFDWVLMWFERKDELNTGKRKCNILGLFHIILSFVRSNILCIQCRRNWDTTGRYSERFSSLLVFIIKTKWRKWQSLRIVMCSCLFGLHTIVLCWLSKGVILSQHSYCHA